MTSVSSKPRRLGYGRVSTDRQTQAQQHEQLTKAGCDVIRTEQISSGKAERPELEATLQDLQKGDTLVVCKLDRLCRSLQELLNLSSELERRQINLCVLDQQLDTSTPAGKLMFHVLGAVAEFERSLAIERTRASVAHRKANGGDVGGRPRSFNPEQLALAQQLQEQGQSVAAISRALGLGRMTVSRMLRSA